MQFLRRLSLPRVAAVAAAWACVVLGLPWIAAVVEISRLRQAPGGGSIAAVGVSYNWLPVGALITVPIGGILVAWWYARR